MLVALILIIGGFGYSQHQRINKYDFSLFTEEDAMNFLEEENIEIPDGVKKMENLDELTLTIIKTVYETEFPPAFSYTELHTFSQQIAEKVRYYMK